MMPASLSSARALGLSSPRNSKDRVAGLPVAMQMVRKAPRDVSTARKVGEGHGEKRKERRKEQKAHETNHQGWEQAEKQ
jgi:hypothetical protein